MGYQELDVRSCLLTVNVFPIVTAGICTDQIQPYCFTAVTTGICNSYNCKQDYYSLHVETAGGLLLILQQLAENIVVDGVTNLTKVNMPTV